MAFLLDIAPIIGGFLMKLFALNQENRAEEQRLTLQLLSSKNEVLNSAREHSKTESPMAAWNRRLIILVILSLIVVYVMAPLFFNVPTAVPVIQEGFSFLGIQLTADEVEYKLVHGLVKYDEIFKWGSVIIEFYFGAQLAKKS